jgi:aminobenzoyl-glutamate utilization protein B
MQGEQPTMQLGLDWIEHNKPQLAALSDAIWGFAEVGLHETSSAAAQADFLEKEGFSVQRGTPGLPTAIVASFGQGKPIIGYLGEYDCLTGVSQKAVPYRDPVCEGGPGHGCGHNLLGVGALGAAVALKREIEAGNAQGTVRYYGCPAEDSASGKVFMAKHGVFNDLDAALTWHPGYLNTVRWGSNLANNSVRFTFHGRTSHAAASPHMGISALDAVELMSVGVNFLREHIIQEARIHYVITKGGDQPNVVPGLAQVWYYVRAPHRIDVEEIYQRVIKIAEGACLMTGATMDITFVKGVHEVMHNTVICDVLEESLVKAGPPQFTAEDFAFAHELEKSFTPGQRAASMRSGHTPPEYWDVVLHDGIAPAFNKGIISSGSTDVAEVSWICPTGEISAATWVCGAAAHSWQATATSGMSIGHKGMITAARTLAIAGFTLMTRPDLLQRAKEEFVKETGGKPYACPLPADMMAPLPQFEDIT